MTAYLCPACRTAVTPEAEAWRCGACSRVFPVLCGIPDFRLGPDPYLSLAEERAKAARLHAFAKDHSFDETVAEYYRITDDVPPDMALRFAAYVRAGTARGEGVLDRLGPDRGPLLDAGCGAGGLVVAAAMAGQQVTGLDIALRWLVIAQKRLEEAGVSAHLVCADIAAPPLPPEGYSRIVATDLFEHLPDPARGAQSLRQLARPGARIFVTGANRFTFAPYPLAGLWGVGFLPARLRRAYVTRRRGFDTLRHATLTSPRQLARLLRDAGFVRPRICALDVPAGRQEPSRRLQISAISVYKWLRTLPLARELLTLTGPAFEITASAPDPVPMTRSERNP